MRKVLMVCAALPMVRVAVGVLAFVAVFGLVTSARSLAALPWEASAWPASDTGAQEHFRDLDGGEVLATLARMPVREWSYKGQDPAIRHVGPTAQDFHAGFRLGDDPKSVGPLDAAGVALRAIQALDARTRNEHLAMLEDTQSLADEAASLVRENAERTAEIAELKSEIAALRADLTSLKRAPR